MPVMMRVVRLGIGVTMVSGFLIAARVANAEIVPNEATLTAEELVEQLGDDSYLRRERARLELERRSYKAHEALEAGLKSDDLEVQYHCERLLVDIRERAIQQQLDEFVKQTDKSKVYDFPAWPALREMLGDEEPVRQLYVDMYRAEPDVMNAVAEGGEGAAAKITSRAMLTQQNMNRFGMQVTPGTISAMLFAGGQEKIALPVNGNSLIYQLCYQQTFRDQFNSETSGPMMRKLLRHHLLRAEDHSVYQGLTLAMQLDMQEEGLLTASKALSGKGPPHVKQYAMMTLARFGNEEHQKLVESSFDDKTVVSQQQVNKVMYKTELRDVALFTTVSLAKQDPKEFGFNRYAPVPNNKAAINVHTLGFENDEKRQEAFDGWKKFSEEQKAKAVENEKK